MLDYDWLRCITRFWLAGIGIVWHTSIWISKIKIYALIRWSFTPFVAKCETFGTGFLVNCEKRNRHNLFEWSHFLTDDIRTIYLAFRQKDEDVESVVISIQYLFIITKTMNYQDHEYPAGLKHFRFPKQVSFRLDRLTFALITGLSVSAAGSVISRNLFAWALHHVNFVLFHVWPVL